MKKDYTIIDDAQKQKLLEGLKTAIQRDCVEGRKFLQQEEASGRTADMPPALFATIKKNIDVREAVFSQLMKDIEQRKPPITLEEYFTQLMLSFAGAPIPEDPTKREYTRLILDLIEPKQMPEVMKKVGPLPPEKTVRGFLKATPDDLNPENLKLMEMRAMTIDRILHVAFDQFYLAQSSALDIDQKNPDYRSFAVAVEKLLGANQGHSGPK